MPSNQTSPAGADIGAAQVTDAAEPLVSLWDYAHDGAVPRIPALQVRVLCVLARQGPMNVTGLARAVGIIASSASRLCDRLEAAGLLQRSANPDRRREITVSLSTEGRRRLQSFAEARRDDFAPILARMSTAGRAALLQGLTEFAAEAI